MTATTHQTSRIKQWRSAVGGWLIILFVAIALSNEINQQALGYTGLIAAIGILILPTRLSPALLWQCGIMFGVGFILLLWMDRLGVPITWHEQLNNNIPLLILFAAISFLRIITVNPTVHKQGKGLSAFIQTFLGAQFLAAVINMSAVIVIADYLKTGPKLNRNITTLAMRGVAIAAYWSPFFAAMAIVLHYLPDINILSIWLYSIPLTVLALTFTILEVRHSDPDKLSQFLGYPIGVKPLMLPVSLLLSVLIARQVWPDIAMVLLVGIASLLIPCLILVKRQGPSQSIRQIGKHISFGLGNLRGEFLLFISAGVLGSGGSVLLNHYPPNLPFETFTAPVASILLLLILMSTLLGAHSIVGIAISAPIILSTDPNTTLLALCYLSTWSIAATMSPFSGLSLMFRGQYQLSLSELWQYHWRYGLFMTTASILMFHLI